MALNPRTEPVPLTINSDGTACVGKTRVPLDTVVYTFDEGATAEEIVQQYPALELADVYAVIAYYLRSREEVEAYLAQRRKSAAQVRAENEVRSDPAGIRERLLARRSRRG